MHNLKFNADGSAAFAYNQERGNPWHTLGTPFQGDQPLQVMLEQIGADRKVSLLPLTVLASDGIHTIEDKWATVREASDTEPSQVLGVVGSRYTPMQDATVAELACEIVGLMGEDAKVDTMGLLGNGEKFFTYVRFEDIVIDPQGIADRIQSGLVGTHAHDGSEAVLFGKTDTRTVCQNTLEMGKRNMSQQVRVKHTAGAEERARVAAAAVGYAAAEERLMVKRAERMLAVPGPLALDTVMQGMFPLEADMTDRQKTKRAATRGAVRRLVDSPTNTCVGFNGWGVYNAVVEWIDWESPMKGGKGLEFRSQRIVTSSSVSDRKAEAADRILALA